MKRFVRTIGVIGLGAIMLVVPTAANAASGTNSHGGQARAKVSYTTGSLSVKLTDLAADGYSANAVYTSDLACVQIKNSNGKGVTTTHKLKATKGTKVTFHLGYGNGYNQINYVVIKFNA